MTLVTTDDVPPPERFDFWREVVGQSLLYCQLEPVSGRPLHAKARTEKIGEVTLADFSGAMVKTYRRGRAEIGRSAPPCIFVQFQLSGSGFIRLGDQEAALSEGDAVIVDGVHGFERGWNEPGRSLTLIFPQDWIVSRVARPDRINGTVLHRANPLSRLLACYLVNGFELAGELSRDAAELFSQHSIDLLSVALAESCSNEPVSSNALREALFVRACRLIRLRDGDPHLTASQISQQLGISTRLLQRIFAERGKTVMRHIFAERTNLAARLLIDPGAAHRTITDIALACGFSDSSHFSRLFTASLGKTPSEWRKQTQ
jgi:AraC family transcriptional regulator, positive regulator of tynA and feaB